LTQSEKGEDIVHTIRDNREIYDVGSAYPGAGEGPKGRSVRPLKRYVSWVQNVNYIAFYHSNVVK